MSKRGKKRRAEELRRKISEADFRFDDLYTLANVAIAINDHMRY
jgi:hypothetical protein